MVNGGTINRGMTVNICVLALCVKIKITLAWLGGGPYENIEKIETFISEIFKMLGYYLTFLTYKLPNFGGFE